MRWSQATTSGLPGAFLGKEFQLFKECIAAPASRVFFRQVFTALIRRKIVAAERCPSIQRLKVGP
jgi:hypothetical protein